MESSIKQFVENEKQKNKHEKEEKVDTTRFRLCFQVFSVADVNGCGILKEICTAFSNVIEDTQAHPQLAITEISDTSSHIQGIRLILH